MQTPANDHDDQVALDAALADHGNVFEEVLYVAPLTPHEKQERRKKYAASIQQLVHVIGETVRKEAEAAVREALSGGRL